MACRKRGRLGLDHVLRLHEMVGVLSDTDHGADVKGIYKRGVALWMTAEERSGSEFIGTPYRFTAKIILEVISVEQGW